MDGNSEVTSHVPRASPFTLVLVLVSNSMQFHLVIQLVRGTS